MLRTAKADGLLHRVGRVPRADEIVAGEPLAVLVLDAHPAWTWRYWRRSASTPDAVTEQLQVEGVDMFAKSFREMLATVGEKVGRVAGRA